MRATKVKRWIEVEARLTESPEDWSPFAEAFVRFGCNSSQVVDSPPSIKAYVEHVPGAFERVERIKRELLKLGASEVAVAKIEDQDWSAIWKQFFKARRVGRRILVVPSWEPVAAAREDAVVTLDPGQAFGTGEHPTTRLCLELLEKAGTCGKEVLDLGCGSGILAIAAAKLGASKVTGSDIEEAAVEIALENAARNGVEIELYAGADFAEWSEGRTWDIVLSNIISATLIRLAPEAATYVKRGGSWIVSGVLEDNWPDVLAAAESASFELVEKLEEDDWVGARLTKV